MTGYRVKKIVKSDDGKWVNVHFSDGGEIVLAADAFERSKKLFPNKNKK